MNQHGRIKYMQKTRRINQLYSTRMMYIIAFFTYLKLFKFCVPDRKLVRERIARSRIMDTNNSHIYIMLFYYIYFII